MSTSAALNIPLPRISAGWFVSYTGFVVILAMLFGGAARQGLWSDAIVELGSLPLLVAAIFRLRQTPLGPLATSALVLLSAIFALPLIQMVPLPPQLWSAIPGRAEIAANYQAAGMALPWLPISLDAAATSRGLLSLIPAAAVFMAMLSQDGAARRRMVEIVLVIVFISVPLDLLQMMGGEASPLRFYAITNVDRAVGFFANSNHNAALLYGAIPLAAAWAIGSPQDTGDGRMTRSILGAILLAAIVVGLAVAKSRAGMMLGFVAGLSCLFVAWRQTDGKSRRTVMRVAVVGNLLAVLLAFQFGFVSFSKRAEEQDLMEDLRWPIATVTMQAAMANQPLGSGFGTFVPVFQIFAPPAVTRDTFINHAHDDWLEVSLEGGIPGIVIMCLSIGWSSVAAFQVWRSGPSAGANVDSSLARAGSIFIVFVLLHSLVDYPLRTIAVMTLFAMSCALLVPSAREILVGWVQKDEDFKALSKRKRMSLPKM